MITEGAGNDTLLGGDGADSPSGKADADVLTGEAGAVQFVFNTCFGADIVTDFQDGIDRIAITTGAERFSVIVVADAGADTLITFAGVSVTLQNVDHTLIGAGDFLFL